MVGTLSVTPQPELLGIEVPHDREPIDDEQAARLAWPEVCEYPEGACRLVRYQNGCTDYIDFRCGELGDDDSLHAFSPCDRPDRP